MIGEGLSLETSSWNTGISLGRVLLLSRGSAWSSELISMGNMSSSSDVFVLSSLFRVSSCDFLLRFLLFFTKELLEAASLGGKAWADVLGSRLLILSTEFLFS